MDDAELMQRVRALRSQGFSTNGIARALGLPRGRVAPLVRAIAREQAAATPGPAVVGCWVSPGWSVGLAVEEGYDWPDREGCGTEASGLVGVLVAREGHLNRGTVSVCGYLVDTYCLGVKDALGPRVMSPQRLRRFVEFFFEPFDGEPVEAPIELARNLVWGAVEYARGLGFEPARDFKPTVGHLGPMAGPSAIGFGCNGKPLYVQGPYDDADRILRALQEKQGMDSFDFLVAAAMEAG